MVGKRAVAVVGTLCGLCGVSRAFLPAARPTAPRTCGTRTWAISGGGDYDLLGGSKPPAKPKMDYDLLGGSSSKPADAGDVPLLEEDPMEMLLAELVFSTEDVRELIFKRLDECDDKFVEFLENKISASTDLDERSALRSLVGVIDGVTKAVEKRLAEEAAAKDREEQEAFAYEARLKAEVEATKARSAEEQARLEEQRKKEVEAKRMQELVAEKAELELAGKDVQQSFEQMLEAFLGLDYSDTAYVLQVVEANYERCTIEFLDILGDRMKAENTPEPAKQKMAVIGQCIEAIMQQRMAKASEKLATLIKSANPNAMIDKVYEMAKAGEVDEPLILLLEANQQQARNAGAAPAAELFNQLLTAAREAIDETLTPARRLIRRLIRLDDSEQRKELINLAFRPKAQALLADGSKTAAEPDVPPPEFISELQLLIKNFGNVDDAFREKLTSIVAEAEEVSVAIYGKPMTIQEQQDYMWSKGTMSVFDLEELESKAQQQGDMMPWQNDKFDAMVPPGFNQDGSRTIGGSRKAL